MQREQTDRRGSSVPWVVALTIIAVAGILSTAGYLVFRSLTRLPTTALERAEETLDSLQELAATFRKGTVENHFVSFATRVSGQTYLQIATVDQIEEFTREDRASILWGTLQLPEVVVSATAPVQYTAYVDLNEPWHLDLVDQRLRVLAPPIRFNQPAIDASRIEFEVREGSLLRDEEAAMAALKRGLTSHAYRRTQELEPVVRETARSQIEEFVRHWLGQSFPAAPEIEIDVEFASQTPEERLRQQASPVD